MARILFLITQLLIVTFISCPSQQVIPISYHKNVNLIFPSEIIKDDCSSTEILMSHDHNILTIGAKNLFEEEKSLTVLTEDAIFYTFIVSYDEDLEKLTYLINDSSGVKIPYIPLEEKKTISTTSGTEPGSSGIENMCKIVSLEPGFFSDQGYTSKRVSLELTGIWINKGRLYFKFHLGNNSNIPYEISSLNVYVGEKAKLKKASSMPVLKEPIFVYNESGNISPKTENNVYILVFEKFTIGKDKKLSIEMVEKRGGRKLQFTILEDLIIKALVIE